MGELKILAELAGSQGDALRITALGPGVNPGEARTGSHSEEWPRQTITLKCLVRPSTP